MTDLIYIRFNHFVKKVIVVIFILFLFIISCFAAPCIKYEKRCGYKREVNSNYSGLPINAVPFVYFNDYKGGCKPVNRQEWHYKKILFTNNNLKGPDGGLWCTFTPSDRLPTTVTCYNVESYEYNVCVEHGDDDD